MSPTVKFLIGLAVALLSGWIGHGPLGQGEAFVDRLDAQSKAVIKQWELPVQVRFERNPLSRQAIEGFRIPSRPKPFHQPADPPQPHTAQASAQ